MNKAKSRDYKVYKNKFQNVQKKYKPPPEMFQYELRAIASKETHVAVGINLKSAIANHFETVLMRNLPGIAFYCRHNRNWYSAIRNETKIEVKKVY